MEKVSIKSLKSYQIGCFILNTKFNIRQYYEFSNVLISREEDYKGKGHLFAYGYSNNDYELVWEFSDKDVFAVSPIVPELKKKEDFISEKHYEKYIKMFKGKELLEVYVASWPYDFRYIIDVNTGEVYNKMQTR